MSRLREDIRRRCQSYTQSLTVNPPWVVPFERNRRFTGRETELATLEQRVFTPDQTSRWAITGLGGVGKTQLVLELLYRIRAANKECIVLWVSADTGASLSQGYTSFTQQLDLPGRHNKNVDVIDLVRKFFEAVSTGQWVLVFDNADDVDLWTKPLPKNEEPNQDSSYHLIDHLPRNERGCIIFTTRSQEVAHTLVGSNAIPLGSVDEKTAVTMFQSYLIRPELTSDTDATAKVLEELAYIPLAIIQAASYFNTKPCTPETYLELLAKQEEEVVDLLGMSLGAEGRYYDIRNPIATTWLKSFEHIEQYDPLAAAYLSTIACVHYKDVPLTLLPSAPSQLAQNNAIGTLIAYSFVERDKTDSTLRLHRLVHLAIRSWLRKRNVLETWQSKTCARFEEVFPSDEYRDRSVCNMYLPHAKYLLESSQMSEPTSQRLSLMRKCARCFFKAGLLNEAEVLFKQVRAACNSKSEMAARYRNQWVEELVERSKENRNLRSGANVSWLDIFHELALCSL